MRRPHPDIQTRIERLEDEAAIAELIGHLAGNEQIRQTSRDRAKRSQQLAEEAKRTDTKSE